MKTLQFNFPHEISNAAEKEIKIAIAALLYDRSEMSSQEAAGFAGLTKRNFLITMGEYAHFYCQVLNGLRKKLTAV